MPATAPTAQGPAHAEISASGDHVALLPLMDALAAASTKKAALPVGPMLLRAFLSGALLAYATALALKTSAGLPPGPSALVAGAVFPVGFAMIVLLGLELATGNFAVLAFGWARRSVTPGALLRNWAWVYLGNLLGSVFVGVLLVLAWTQLQTHGAGALGDRVVEVALSKTHAYAEVGAPGWWTAFVKGVLCNWMVALGTVLGFSSTSSAGKIASVWLPVATFFALALEHSIVNMFLMPTAMLLGADITLTDWLWWNQVPVTLGNIVGGALLTGLLFHWAAPPGKAAATPVAPA